MKKLWILPSLIVLISGCATVGDFASRNVTNREDKRLLAVTNHPEWPDPIKKAITEGTIIVGMTQEQTITSIAKPYKINKTVGAWGVHEQWLYYGDLYVYFENGALTSYQVERA